MSIHRLVALAYIPNPKNHPYVIHINKYGFDNRVENLEWSSSLSKYMTKNTTLLKKILKNLVLPKKLINIL